MAIANNTQMANNGIAEKWCYNNDELLCLEYGALYQWDEAMQYTTVKAHRAFVLLRGIFLLKQNGSRLMITWEDTTTPAVR